MIDDSEVPGAHPPKDHPLSKLAARLGELLDEDQWAEVESLVLKAWKFGENANFSGERSESAAKRGSTAG